MWPKIFNTLKSPDRFQRIRDYAVARFLYALPAGVRKRAFSGEVNYCPVCESYLSQFMVLHRAHQLWCPVCRSMSRHRLVYNFLKKQTNLFNSQPKRLLHVAPEPSLAPRLAEAPGLEYISADLQDPAAMVKMDITSIQYGDETFDAIYCSHVLEHVPDDRKALEECYRVLKEDGWTLMLVPIGGETSYEDPSITDPQDRERAFGQFDHVRLYGLDFAERMEESGFNVSIYKAEDIEPEEARRMGLPDEEYLFFGQK